MIKKLLNILVGVFLIVSLVGCSTKKENANIVAMEPVNIDFSVESSYNGEIAFDYPSDKWEETSLFGYVILYYNSENKNPEVEQSISIAEPKKS